MTRRIERMTPAGIDDEYGARAEESLLDAIGARRPPGTGSITGTTTLGELLTRYIKRCREDGQLAPKSVDTYEATLNAVRSRLADIRVSEATAGLLDEIMRGILRDHGAIRERHTKVALNAVLTDAVLAGAIAANPVRELGQRKRHRKTTVKGAPALDVDRVRTLLKALAEPEVCEVKDLRNPVVLLAATGLRRSELLGSPLGRCRPCRPSADDRGIGGAVEGKGLVRQHTTKAGGARSVPLPLRRGCAASSQGCPAAA